MSENKTAEIKEDSPQEQELSHIIATQLAKEIAKSLTPDLYCYFEVETNSEKKRLWLLPSQHKAYLYVQHNSIEISFEELTTALVCIDYENETTLIPLSTNQIKVNGKVVLEVISLKDGDELQLNEISCRFVDPNAKIIQELEEIEKVSLNSSLPKTSLTESLRTKNFWAELKQYQLPIYSALLFVVALCSLSLDFF